MGSISQTWGVLGQPQPASTEPLRPLGMGDLPVFNIWDFGATGSNFGDDTGPVLEAIDKAEVSGGIVFAPPGTYLLNPPGAGGSALVISRPGVVLAGAGRGSTKFVLANSSMELLAINGTGAATPGTADGLILSGIAFDTAAYNCQAALAVQANNCLLLDCEVEGGSNIYAIFFAGPQTATQAAPVYNTGNRIENLILTDSFNGDGLSWSFQQHSTIKNVLHNGSRLAIYICDDLAVNDYSYTPGAAVPAGSQNGYYITEPSSDIRIDGFNLESGGNPVIGNPDATYFVSNASIRNSKQAAGSRLRLGDFNHLVLDNVTLPAGAAGGAHDAYLDIDPSSAADNLVVKNSSIAQVTVGPNAPVTFNTTAQFTDCEWPAVTNTALTQAVSLLQPSGLITSSVRVTGGFFYNAANGFVYLATQPGTWHIKDVYGYNPVGEDVAPGTAIPSPVPVQPFDSYVEVTNGSAAAITISITGGTTIVWSLPAGATQSYFLPAGCSLTPSATASVTYGRQGL